MSSIEALIKVKKHAKTDDLVRLLDEVTIYEKLAKSKAFRDLNTSQPARKKCPLLASAYDGDLYAMSLVTVAGHVIAHLDNIVPQVLTEPMAGLSQREHRKMEVMQNQIIHVRYDFLTAYDHKTMEKQVVAVYTSERETETAILIIVRNDNEYVIYQGYYKEQQIVKNQKQHQPYVETRGQKSLVISNYSIQGNNAYPFGQYITAENTYSVMLPNHEAIWVFKDIDHPIVIPLSIGDRNQLTMTKQSIQTFTATLFDILEREELV